MSSEQLEQYKAWLSKEPQVGDKYVIIDAKWFEHWKRFVGIDASDEKTVTDPGPMDFQKLIDSSVDSGPNEVQLRTDAVEGNDYTFIPYALFKNLLDKHKKVGPEIIRKAIPKGQFDVVIETFLVPLRLRQSRTPNARTKQIYRSRRTKISDLKEDICKEFNMSKSPNLYLYASTDVMGSNWEMIDDAANVVLEDIDLIKNAFIIYESRALATRSAIITNTIYTPGLCGLSNLGNTCFMNSALQCLSNVPELTRYFVSGEYKQHINRDNPLGMKGDVAQAYGELLHEMWSGRTNYYAPKSLKHSVARYAPQFSGYAQQDSQEFMSFLLDGLHEDLNLVKQKPYVEKKDDDGTLSDATLSAQDWENYRKRNQSKIHDIFHGQIKSVVQCLTCSTRGRTFDPICFLSLPLPNKKLRTFKIDYVRLKGQVKSYQIKFNEHDRMHNLIQAFCARFKPKEKTVDAKEPMETDGVASSKKANPDEEEQEEEEEEEEEDFTKSEDYDGHQPRGDYILAAEVYNHRIHLQYADNALLTSVMDRDQIVFYEVADSLKKTDHGNILMPCVFRESDHRQHFGLPIYVVVPRQKCTGKDIQDALEKVIGYFLPLSSTDPTDKSQYTALCSLTQNYHQQSKALSTLLDEHIDFGRTSTSLIVDVSSSIVEKYKKQEREEEEKQRTGKDQRSSVDDIHQARSQGKRSTTLLDCFKHFTSKETLSDDDLWFCPKCKELKRATKKIDLWLLPNVLIVQLKRFSYTRYYRDKIDGLIDCPLRDLDLSQYVLNPDEKAKAKYDLIAVSNHMGGLGGGHYTAHAKNHNDQRWHTFDDSYVSDVSEDSVISKSAYVLVYQQKPTPTATPSQSPRNKSAH